MSATDDLSIPRHGPATYGFTPRTIPSAGEPLSCYLIPDFWRGAHAARMALEISNTHSNEMLTAIDSLARATAANEDIRTLAAYHRWMGQGTKPPEPAEEGDE